MARLPRGDAWRFPRSSGRLTRLHRYLRFSLVAVWSSVAVLGLLEILLQPTPTLLDELSLLLVYGILLGAAEALALRGRVVAAAAVTTLATWGTSLAIVWVSPFLAPVGLLALLLPLVMVADLLGPRLLTPTIVATVVLSGVLAGTGVARRPAYERVHPVTPWTVTLVAVLVTVLVSALVSGLRKYITQLAEHTRELEESRARLAVASIEARRSIERDLHDGAQQRLATIAVDLGRATRTFDSDPAQARSIVHGLQDQLEAAIRELRDLAHGIYPPLLGERGLVGALPAAARRTTLPCTVDVRSLGRHVPPVEAAVYFCCLEAIQNADRHSGATLITVQAGDDNGPGQGLWFRVADDGRGFDPEAVRSTHGLTGMRDRIRAAGGELRITSEPGAGTTVEGRFEPGTQRPR